MTKHCNGNLYFRQDTNSSKEDIMYHQIKKPLSTQLSDEVRNVLPVFPVLTECDYANPFYRRSEIQNFKKMFLKPELTALIQFLKTTILTF